MRVLVVEDAKDLNRLIVKVLVKAGYSVDGCFNGEEAIEYLTGAEYDAMLLDVMMPKLDGFTLLEQLRNQGNEIPVLMLTAKDAIADRVKGLDLGADDYLIKPFDFDELLARIRNMTRKRNGNKNNIFQLADLKVDVQSRSVFRGNNQVELLPKEFTILEYLIRNKGIVVSREQLEDKIWNYEYVGSSNNIDGYMSRLRKKIDGDDMVKLLHTIRGVGWVLREEK
ncbi:MAG: response regulator transcription factor [Firmicutes bacterium]|nr:response regulator transcription factor [Bacillota bacterium]